MREGYRFLGEAAGLIRQPKFNPHMSVEVYRLPVALRGPEANQLCCLKGGFIQTVSQAAHYADHLHLA